jgi:hypothetical protein
MSEFKYLDIVEVRDSETHEWKEPRFYLGSVEAPFTGKMHITMWPNQNQYTFTGHVDSWVFVRKYEGAPKPPTTEERLEYLEAALAKLQNP